MVFQIGFLSCYRNFQKPILQKPRKAYEKITKKLSTVRKPQKKTIFGNRVQTFSYIFSLAHNGKLLAFKFQTFSSRERSQGSSMAYNKNENTGKQETGYN